MLHAPGRIMNQCVPPLRDLALTICSVSFHNAHHLALNWNFTRKLNANGANIRWIVAENTPEGGHARLSSDDERFHVIAGVTGFHRVSYHHTEALQNTLRHVRTRFLLVLDPDFYIVRDGWCDEILTHMLRHELTIFGVPWHPKYTDKFRYFPTVHCVFVDLARIDIDALDFRPCGPDEPVHDVEAESDRRPKTGVFPLAAQLFDALTLRHRRKEFRDSGTRMYTRYAHDARIRYECAVPVYRRPQRSWRSRLIESLLPDSLCYLPKRRDSYTEKGFSEIGFGPEIPSNWEEFMWKGAPLGFHMRRNAKKVQRNEMGELDELGKVLAALCRDTRAYGTTPDV